MVSLSVEYRNYYTATKKLDDLQLHIGSLEPKYRKVIMEIILLRLFDIFTMCIASIAAKIVCGALYVDGARPLVLMPARSTTTAFNNMTYHARPKPKTRLYWSRVRDIKDNTKYVIDTSDHFIQVLDHHSILISEMRNIRNRIAHNNERSRRHYRAVVLRYYGAYLNYVSPGTLLLTPKQTPSLIQQYLIKSRVLVKELVRA